jgi:hypothetical protein
MVDRSRALEAMALEEVIEARAQREEESKRTGKEDRIIEPMFRVLGVWAGRCIQPGPEPGSQVVTIYGLQFRISMLNPIRREVISPSGGT